MKKNKWIMMIVATLSVFACVLGIGQNECMVEQKAVAEGSRDSLEEIARTYLGVYECKSLYFGGEDKKDIFEYFRLELKPKGELLLRYKLKNSRENQIPLTYEYDFAEKTVWVRGQWGVFKVDKKFPLKKGVLSVTMNIFGKVAVVEFSR